MEDVFVDYLSMLFDFPHPSLAVKDNEETSLLL